MKWLQRSVGGFMSRLVSCIVACFLACAGIASAQTCYMADDMDAATRTALISTGKQYFDLLAKGDGESLKQKSVASLASDFSSVEAAVRDNQANFAGAQANPRPPFLLKVEGTAPLARAEFLCGVFGKNGQTENSAEFVIPNLPPGNYAVVIDDVSSSKGSRFVTYILQQQGADWKLGGLYIKPSQVAGHDGAWYEDKARAFKSKGQNHNAWFYYLEARDLLVPVRFMYTQATDKLYDESQAIRPTDLPMGGNTVDLSVAGKTYKLTDLFSAVVGQDLDLVVKYQVADVSDSGKTFAGNIALIKALVEKYPEFRDAFTGVVARAVEPSGRDYGTLEAMKDIK
jgi:hypothetical protein